MGGRIYETKHATTFFYKRRPTFHPLYIPPYYYYSYGWLAIVDTIAATPGTHGFFCVL